MTANTWFCEVLHTEFGPLSWDDLRGMVTRGTLRPKDRVRQHDGGWRSASDVEGLFAPPPTDDATDFEIVSKPPADESTDFDLASPPPTARNEDLDFDLSG